MTSVDKHNLTELKEYILLGITHHPELQAPLFVLFLIIYMISLVGNLGMVILTKVDPRLQTPMYFFLRHLALTDLGYSTAVGPKMLVNFLAEQNTIPFYFCATQMAFFIMFIINELFVLATMSYDRYVAICNPLLYTVIMSQRLCLVLVAIPYVYSTCISLLITVKLFNLSFCNYVVNHFYCDNLPVLILVCSNTQEVEFLILIFSVLNLVFTLLVVVVSYLLILIAILRMKSAEGRRKAFSTCGSHLTVVTVFYGTLTFMYVNPKSTHSFDTDKMASIFYTLIIPMLNPLIYILRNKDVKCALQKM
ncbi:olfactory receptor 8K3-like [Sorex araneus]|uniref:olfactory receptor 8K3-like n=1 Tax=Sorex araneus TaxID=42254 RepID=UPI002433690B|nr:olfactory receptor 8K3-like [Sorex araneus]